MYGRGAALVLACLAAPAYAQQQSSPILTLDQDRLYTASAFGQRVQSDLQQQSQDLSQENRRIEAALETEELRLTEERAEMDPEAFAALAQDFDERVTGIRRAQEAKADNIRRVAEQERARFFEAAFPVLLELVEETGAIAILNNEAVIFSVRQIDITDAAIARVDSIIGAAPLPPDPGQVPQQRPSTEVETAPLPEADAESDDQ
ncbi:periplasmic chaperone for outer membrane proteins Skp [Litoreibacter ponti]|uniref:Periplasmic chaperone for outer membrane proteins Skp n=1 Tax=Litoreibacter ponti TaxID=1510457 RepID=A0A2T6BIK8_9RHOB|nr:OmpH family outer membrane protein [Litoreibacter ponti]PTX55889.1 periplasmic chaperone for outer membrane proteins Skp [Litoreibacter ponti]